MYPSPDTSWFDCVFLQFTVRGIARNYRLEPFTLNRDACFAADVATFAPCLADIVILEV